MSFGETMMDSIKENLYIVVFAVLALIFLVMSYVWAIGVNKCFEPNKEEKLKKFNYYTLDVLYTLFITIISIFPLLGMFGTVKALLELDMTGQIEDIKVNFFSALTSTAWGIVFAIAFKVINAFFQSFIENQIKRAKEFLNI